MSAASAGVSRPQARGVRRDPRRALRDAHCNPSACFLRMDFNHGDHTRQLSFVTGVCSSISIAVSPQWNLGTLVSGVAARWQIDRCTAAQGGRFGRVLNGTRLLTRDASSSHRSLGGREAGRRTVRPSTRSLRVVATFMHAMAVGSGLHALPRAGGIGKAWSLAPAYGLGLGQTGADTSRQHAATTVRRSRPRRRTHGTIAGWMRQPERVASEARSWTAGGPAPRRRPDS